MKIDFSTLSNFVCLFMSQVNELENPFGRDDLPKAIERWADVNIRISDDDDTIYLSAIVNDKMYQSTIQVGFGQDSANAAWWMTPAKERIPHRLKK